MSSRARCDGASGSTKALLLNSPRTLAPIDRAATNVAAHTASTNQRLDTRTCPAPRTRDPYLSPIAGSIRSSALARSHQFQRPSRRISAGTISTRISDASSADRDRHADSHRLGDDHAA